MEQMNVRLNNWSSLNHLGPGYFLLWKYFSEKYHFYLLKFNV